MQRHGARLLGPLAIVIAVLAVVPPSASAAGWVCEASALRAEILGQAPIEPAAANRGAGDCEAAASTGGVLPQPPVDVSATALTATTGLAGPVAGPVHEQAATARCPTSPSRRSLRCRSSSRIPTSRPWTRSTRRSARSTCGPRWRR